MIFLALMVAGLTGLIFMALPGLAGHGHFGAGTHGIGHVGHAGHVGHVGHAGHAGHAQGHAAHPGQTQGQGGEADGAQGLASRLTPNPRAIFSLLTLFGAFGYAFSSGAHLSTLAAALAALIPALVVERYLVDPVWNGLMAFQGKPSSPLEEIVLQEARAVTAFHNGRGMVSVERDGRIVQLLADLTAEHATMPVRVGDTLRIENVDAVQERVTVSPR